MSQTDENKKASALWTFFKTGCFFSSMETYLRISIVDLRNGYFRKVGSIYGTLKNIGSGIYLETINF